VRDCITCNIRRNCTFTLFFYKRNAWEKYNIWYKSAAYFFLSLWNRNKHKFVVQSTSSFFCNFNFAQLHLHYKHITIVTSIRMYTVEAQRELDVSWRPKVKLCYPTSWPTHACALQIGYARFRECRFWPRYYSMVTQYLERTGHYSSSRYCLRYFRCQPQKGSEWLQLFSDSKRDRKNTECFPHLPAIGN
jgi:hypothetical protein